MSDTEPNSSHLPAFRPDDPAEAGLRDHVVPMLLLAMFGFGLNAVMVYLIQSEYAPERASDTAFLALPFAALGWDLIRHLRFGPLPAHRLHELRRYASLNRLVLKRAWPYLLASGLLWTTENAHWLTMAIECAFYGLLHGIVLALALKWVFMRRKRDFIRVAQRFAYG